MSRVQRPSKTWLDETYPDIARRAKKEDAEIHWADETAVMNTDVRGRSYAPRGNAPVMRMPARRQGNTP